MQKKFFFVKTFILLFSIIAAGIGLLPFEKKRDEQSLSVQIVERLMLTLPNETIHKNGLNKLSIWIPLPASDSYQSVESLKIESPWSYKIIHDPDFNNKILFIDLTDSLEKKSQAIIKWKYKIIRKEQNGFSFDDRDRFSDKLFLSERGLVIIDNRIREIEKKITSSITDPFEKAKAIYNYVLTHVDYDTSVPGWGNGDVEYVCKVGKGNCTDFHSLFISLLRAAGIPARFQIGFPVPPEENSGILVKPYHCWAEFFIEGKGWTPVDISEAWKYPEKKKYYLGNLDKDRILISTGRGIRLLPDKSEEAALNYFVKPYVELDGISYEQFEIERSFAKTEEK